MEGYSGENTSADSKENSKDKKVSKAAGLGGRTFEFAKKTDAAEKLADTSSIWEKLIPKEKSETPESEPKLFESDKADNTAEAAAEEAEDPTVETLSETEKAEVAKDYAQEKKAELEAGRTDAEEPAEAAAREANIEFLEQVEKDAEAVPIETVEEVSEESEAPVVAEGEETPPTANESEGLSELAHDEAIELNAPETVPTETQAEAEESDVTPPAVPPTAPPRSNPLGPGGSSASFNTMPTAAATPNILTTANERDDRSNEAAYFVAGGILGYLLGRRRGRIKTEKRMKAVTKKLEQQIKDTRDQIQRQEQTIREDARRRYNETHVARGAETTAARTVGNTPRAESITDLTRQEVRRPTPEQTASAERVQHMQHHEVLAIAEKVTIDGTSLRKIYEAKQITEPGLRRLTREYLRGGDLKAALQQELAVKEMQYERDPQMRDRLAASYAGVDAASPQASKEAMAALLAQGQQTPASQMYSNVQQAADDAHQAKHKAKQLLISAWAVLIVVLVVVAVVLATR